MSLLASLAGLIEVLLSALVFAAAGRFLLDRSSVRIQNGAERLLFSLAVGVVAAELLTSLGELVPDVRAGILCSLIPVIALGIPALIPVGKDIRAILGNMAGLPFAERSLAIATTGVLFIEGLAAMAPLTGSDALHYHFAAQAAILRDGYHPNWFLAHSFFTGLGHQLILAGLAIGSERLAMGWIFVGGAASVLAAAVVVRQWIIGPWPWLAALTFLLTPVAFWQITTAGAPDIWMAFFVTLGVLAVVRAKEGPSASAVALAGVLAGAVAGTKYTGLILAACMFVAFLVEIPSARKVALFFATAAAIGVWPYLRNFAWTGDPLFPFLMRHLAPARVNSFALAGMLADTGASSTRHFWQIAGFPLFAYVDPAHLGFWQFLGPLVLCLAPLTILAIRNTPQWRVVLIVWTAGALAICLTSGMTRFLLPLFPVALAASVAGVAAVSKTSWRSVRTVAIASILGFLLFGLGGLLVYDRAALACAAGLTSRDEYLEQRAPDFEICDLLNRALSVQETDGRALVFFRHVYYLRVPYLYGDPSASWAMDPGRLQSDSAWRTLFRSRRIRWVVRAPRFPKALRAALDRLVEEKLLVPCASGAVQNWSGNRIGGSREAQPVTIFCVQN